MSVQSPPSTATSRRPSADEVRQIAEDVRQWAGETNNVASAAIYTHPTRPTVRCAVVSRTREYDRALDDAVTELDLSMARHPSLSGVDLELKLFFAACADQVAAWARGWEPLTDA